MNTLLGYAIPALAGLVIVGLAFVDFIDWLIGRELRRSEQDAHARADDDGFAQQRTPEDLGRWPFGGER